MNIPSIYTFNAGWNLNNENYIFGSDSSQSSLDDSFIREMNSEEFENYGLEGGIILRDRHGETLQSALYACNNGYPFSVKISSQDDFASTGQIGFQLITRGRDGEAMRANLIGKLKPCQFCAKSPEITKNTYLTHSLRDPVTHTVTCPFLRSLVCEVCGDTGDWAHTSRHCPARVGVTEQNRKFLHPQWGQYFQKNKFSGPTRK